MTFRRRRAVRYGTGGNNVYDILVGGRLWRVDEVRAERFVISRDVGQKPETFSQRGAEFDSEYFHNNRRVSTRDRIVYRSITVVERRPSSTFLDSCHHCPRQPNARVVQTSKY